MKTKPERAKWEKRNETNEKCKEKVFPAAVCWNHFRSEKNHEPNETKIKRRKMNEKKRLGCNMSKTKSWRRPDGRWESREVSLLTSWSGLCQLVSLFFRFEVKPRSMLLETLSTLCCTVTWITRAAIRQRLLGRQCSNFTFSGCSHNNDPVPIKAHHVSVELNEHVKNPNGTLLFENDQHIKNKFRCYADAMWWEPLDVESSLFWSLFWLLFNTKDRENADPEQPATHDADHHSNFTKWALIVRLPFKPFFVSVFRWDVHQTSLAVRIKPWSSLRIIRVNWKIFLRSETGFNSLGRLDSCVVNQLPA